MAKYTYDAWGYILSITDANGNVITDMNHIGHLNPFRYRGYYYDTETGSYYLQSRYYDPGVRRFFSADGEMSGVGGEILGYNMFAYCMNNPVNMADPSGNWPKWLSGALNVVSGAKTQVRDSGVCTACGATLPEGAEFCISCGKAVNLRTPEPMEVSQAASSAPPQDGAGLVGFSDKCNSPEILAAAQKNKKSSIGCMWILVFVPLIGFPVAGLLMDDFPFGESLVIGVGIALVMLVVNLLALRKTKQPMWEGVVVNKYSKEKSEHRGGEDDNWRTYTEYNTIINTDAGKKKTIVEKDSGRHMYDYLSVGDRVRFHPRFGTYEKYDKSKDRIIYCNVCSMMNPIQNDRCKRCNNLLLK